MQIMANEDNNIDPILKSQMLQELQQALCKTRNTYNEATIERLLREGGPSIVNGYVHVRSFADEITLLMACAFKGNDHIARMMIRYGCPINTALADGNTALHFACLYDNFDVARELIRAGANVGAKSCAGSTTLESAILAGIRVADFIQIGTVSIQVLCASGLRDQLHAVKRCANNHCCCCFDSDILNLLNRDIVKMMLDAGVGVNNRDAQGYSSIQMAALTGNIEIVKMIVDAGADINSRSDSGITALHCAVLHYTNCNQTEVLGLLLNRGANVHAKCKKKGDTPLHWAAELNNDNNGYREIFKILMDFGSNVNEKNKKGHTVLDILTEKEAIVGSRIAIEYVAEMELYTRKQVFDEYNLAVIDSNPMMKSYYEEYRRTIEDMSSRAIGDTLITYLDVWTKPVRVVACYARNENFVKEFNARLYPLIQSRLEAQFQAAVARQKLIQQICTVLSTILHVVNLNDKDIFETIVQYLSEEDSNILLEGARAEGFDLS